MGTSDTTLLKITSKWNKEEIIRTIIDYYRLNNEEEVFD